MLFFPSQAHLSSGECFYPLSRQRNQSSSRRIYTLTSGHRGETIAQYLLIRPSDYRLQSIDRMKNSIIPLTSKRFLPTLCLFKWQVFHREASTHLSHLEATSTLRSFLTFSKLLRTTSDPFKTTTCCFSTVLIHIRPLTRQRQVLPQHQTWHLTDS